MKLNRKQLRRLIESALQEDNSNESPWKGNVFLPMFRNDSGGKHFDKFLSSKFMENPGFSTLEDRLIHRDTIGSFADINDNDIMCPAKAVTTVGDNKSVGFE